ncbi:hypothetical protein [Escherichia coli]|uniref:hypothetical protein n=1 Tax=Escherichia coli TaxID=562 RepID=UPI00287A6A13|nr:hypothetical protein [Escherichia coli]MDS1617145.1 hypothetical protein [Escherichia coli]
MKIANAQSRQTLQKRNRYAQLRKSGTQVRKSGTQKSEVRTSGKPANTGLVHKSTQSIPSETKLIRVRTNVCVLRKMPDLPARGKLFVDGNISGNFTQKVQNHMAQRPNSLILSKSCIAGGRNICISCIWGSVVTVRGIFFDEYKKHDEKNDQTIKGRMGR